MGSNIALKTFEHVLILADDVDKTKDFYVDILGLGLGIGQIFHSRVIGYI